ncbi:MAG: beta-galactosidase [Anaerolineales bacterium]|nr:beta-galactosidase [Anaerolineales bacterium]MDW8227679.1 beta-galactosidase [Anaerolineales bacterium]
MRHLAIRDNLFWLDHRPVLLQAGEFHYYRTPSDQWAHRLGLLKAAGFNAVATYIPWRWHEIEEGVLDFDGHSHPMRNLVGFLDLAASLDLWILPRPGPYIMAETINEGIPDWVFSKYPQVALIDQHGKPHNIVSYLHPDFLACAARWYRAVFSVLAPRQVTRGGRILAVQLDNEMGMIHWVRNILDTNPDTLARFAAYRRSGSVQLSRSAPNKSDELSDLPSNWTSDARAVEEYRRFFRCYLREYATFLLSEARANGLEVPPIINIHGFANGGKTFPIGLSQLIEVMELPDVLSATDVYPIFIGEGNYHELLLVNEMTRALQNPAQPLFSMEFQAGGNQDFSGAQTSFYDLHTRLSLSVGMRAINHYLFFDGENDPLLSPMKRHDWGHPVRKDGSLRRHYHRYPKLSATLAAYGEALTLARPETVTTIGFRLDDFMTEVNTPATETTSRILTHQRETILFDFIARGLALTHRPFRALELARATLDPQETPTLWVMTDHRCEASLQQKLVEYMRSGGKLALLGRLPQEDETGQACTLLRQALGVTAVQSDPPFTPTHITAFGYEDIPVSFVETYQGTFDEVLATRKNETVAFLKHFPQGKAVVFGAALKADTLDDLDVFHRLALALDLPPAFTLSDWADVRLSRGPLGKFLFINNYQDDPIETKIAWQGERLFGGEAIRLPARQGAILPLDWPLAEGILIHYLTAEVRQIAQEPDGLVLHLAQDEFVAEFSLQGWECPAAQAVSDSSPTRLRLRGQTGRLTFKTIHR